MKSKKFITTFVFISVLSTSFVPQSHAMQPLFGKGGYFSKEEREKRAAAKNLRIAQEKRDLEQAQARARAQTESPAPVVKKQTPQGTTNLSDRLVDYVNKVVKSYQGNWAQRRWQDIQTYSYTAGTCTFQALKTLGVGSFHAVMDSVPVASYVDYIVARAIKGSSLDSQVQEYNDAAFYSVPGVKGEPMYNGQLLGGAVSAVKGLRDRDRAKRTGDSDGVASAFDSTKLAYAPLTHFFKQEWDPATSRCLEGAAKTRILRKLQDIRSQVIARQKEELKGKTGEVRRAYRELHREELARTTRNFGKSALEAIQGLDADTLSGRAPAGAVSAKE